MKNIQLNINQYQTCWGNNKSGHSFLVGALDENAFEQALTFEGIEQEIILRSNGIPYERWKNMLIILKKYKYNVQEGKSLIKKVMDEAECSRRFISFTLIFKINEEVFNKQLHSQEVLQND